MKNLGALMKQASQMQSKMAEMQAQLAALEVTGQSGGGMIVATLGGKGDIKRIKIDKALVDPNDVEVLEDLLVAALNDARAKVDAATAERMRDMTGGLDLPPGLKLPF